MLIYFWPCFLNSNPAINQWNSTIKLNVFSLIDFISWLMRIELLKTGQKSEGNCSSGIQKFHQTDLSLIQFTEFQEWRRHNPITDFTNSLPLIDFFWFLNSINKWNSGLIAESIWIEFGWIEWKSMKEINAANEFTGTITRLKLTAGMI